MTDGWSCSCFCSRWWKEEFLPPKEEWISEVKTSLKMALPTLVTNSSVYFMSLVNISFLGHLGSTELAGASVAIMLLSVCLAFATGLLCAIDTMSSQAYGAGNTRKVGIILQRSLLIATVFAIPAILIYCFAEPILLLLGQTEGVAKSGAEYSRILSISVIPMYYNEALKRSLIAAGIVVPQMISGVINIGLVALLDYLFINVFGFGFKGAAVALTAVYVVQPLIVLGIIFFSGSYKKIWSGWSKECFHEIWPFLKLGIPGMLMMGAEWTAFEGAAIFAGIIGENELSGYSVLYNTQNLFFTIPTTLGIVVSTRVGYNLGAGKPQMARFCTFSYIVAGLICQVMYFSLLLALRNVWGKMFTDDEAVLNIISKYLPYSLLVQTFDVTQAICSGVLRGCGFQFFGGLINIICYFFIGIPLAAIFIFLVKKDLKMIYFAFTISIFTQTVIFFIRILLVKWKKMSEAVMAKEEATAIDMEVEAGDALKEGEEEEEIDVVNDDVDGDEKKEGVDDGNGVMVNADDNDDVVMTVKEEDEKALESKPLV